MNLAFNVFLLGIIKASTSSGHANGETRITSASIESMDCVLQVDNFKLENNLSVRIGKISSIVAAAHSGSESKSAESFPMLAI